MKVKLAKKYYNDIRGAVYIPTRAYNAYQMWRDYSEEVTKRDFGYAKKLNINALRLWLSYEYWKDSKQHFEKSFESLLDIASSMGLKVMPSLFECCGREPEKSTIEDTNPLNATAVKSPGTDIEKDMDLWQEPLEYMEWFMNKYRDDERLLAIEIINEPKLTSYEDVVFSQAMLQRASEHRGKLPLTIGSITLMHNLPFIEYGLDILQTHVNFVLSQREFSGILNNSKALQKLMDRPLWITEWQRMRKSSCGWASDPSVDMEETLPKHRSMIEEFREFGLGNFIWSLMLKPAYLTPQRRHGTFNGIFHEDGSVYSLEDARVVSENMDFKAVENKTIPEIFKPVREHLDK